MATPDPESYGLLGRLIAAAAAIVTPVGGLWIYIDSRFAKKHTVNNQFHEIKLEQKHQREVQAKIFDKMGEAEAKNEERHRELLMHLLKRDS